MFITTTTRVFPYLKLEKKLALKLLPRGLVLGDVVPKADNDGDGAVREGRRPSGAATNSPRRSTTRPRGRRARG